MEEVPETVLELCTEIADMLEGIVEPYDLASLARSVARLQDIANALSATLLKCCEDEMENRNGA